MLTALPLLSEPGAAPVVEAGFVCAASNSRISLMKVDSYIRPLVTSKFRNPRIGGILFGSLFGLLSDVSKAGRDDDNNPYVENRRGC